MHFVLAISRISICTAIPIVYRCICSNDAVLGVRVERTIRSVAVLAGCCFVHRSSSFAICDGRDVLMYHVALRDYETCGPQLSETRLAQTWACRPARMGHGPAATVRLETTNEHARLNQRHHKRHVGVQRVEAQSRSAVVVPLHVCWLRPHFSRHCRPRVTHLGMRRPCCRVLRCSAETQMELFVL